MVDMKGLTPEQIMEIYYASTPEVRKWMHENVGEWKRKTPNEESLELMFSYPVEGIFMLSDKNHMF